MCGRVGAHSMSLSGDVGAHSVLLMPLSRGGGTGTDPWVACNKGLNTKGRCKKNLFVAEMSANGMGVNK